MNVYDFDDTIFRGDSTRAFWAYCLKLRARAGTLSAPAVRRRRALCAGPHG